MRIRLVRPIRSDSVHSVYSVVKISGKGITESSEYTEWGQSNNKPLGAPAWSPVCCVPLSGMVKTSQNMNHRIIRARTTQNQPALSNLNLCAPWLNPSRMPLPLTSDGNALPSNVDGKN